MTTEQAAASRQPAPALQFHQPTCPVCGDETHDDDGLFACESCRCRWSTDGTFHSWDEPGTAQCDSTNYNSWSGRTARCVLAAGHGQQHGDGVVCVWSGAGTPTPSLTLGATK